MQAEITGSTMPVLEVSLGQGEQLISAHGELAWMTPGVQMSQTTSAGRGGGGFMRGLKRVIGGGGLFLTRYEGPGMVAFAAKVPGHITPVDIRPGEEYFVHRHGFLCGTGGVSPAVGLQQSFRGGLFGGEGFLLQKLEGQGRAWIELSGELTTYDLPAGQTLLVHPGHVGMFAGSVSFQITRVPGVANILFGGDGLHLVALTGPGRVWLQSMPLVQLAAAIQPYLPTPVSSTGGAAASGAIAGDMMSL
ncbi:MAG: AIM24 family protein [Streptosporangiaceae bacterium]|nr:AIM24 family protein [Streptosporangiaceae bacterium]